MTLREGEPCKHPGCLSHVSHPCEGCGRVAGRYRRVGFTGTHKGASTTQLAIARAKLVALQAQGFGEFHHGLCIGADEQVAKIAKELGYRVVAHPGLAKDPNNLLYRSDWSGSDETREAKPFIERDHDIVDETEVMLATPLTYEEQVRSGTWTTVRYAKSRGRKDGETLFVIKPPFMPPSWAQTNAIAGDDPKALIKRGVK